MCNMDLVFRQQGSACVVEVSGDLDDSAVLTPEQEARLFELFQPGCEITFDVANVRRLTSVGLRQLLLLKHQRQLRHQKLHKMKLRLAKARLQKMLVAMVK